MSAIGLRPFVPADVPRCLSIFATSIAELAGDDYDDDQCEAWIATAEDERAFAKRLRDSLTLMATVDGEEAGFASLKGPDVIDMVYVDPEFARQGVGAALLDALTKLAAARGATTIRSEVSDTAKPLFERQGFTATSRNLVTLGDQWLANTSMSKTLAPRDPSANARS